MRIDVDIDTDAAMEQLSDVGKPVPSIDVKVSSDRLDAMQRAMTEGRDPFAVAGAPEFERIVEARIVGADSTRDVLDEYRRRLVAVIQSGQLKPNAPGYASWKRKTYGKDTPLVATGELLRSLEVVTHG